jgi:hypothetical protein
LKQALIATLWLFVSACATSQRVEREAALPEGSRQQLDKFRQFMTTRQVDEFLLLTDDVARTEYVNALRIDERLAGYSRPIQDAIWAREVVKGMDKPAVLLSWGTPREREFSGEGGNEIETWTYVREQKQLQVVVTNGYVTDVIDQGFSR